VRSAAVVWVGIFGLATLPLASCGDEDTTGLITRGGSGGASGSSGAAGNAGSAGRGGSGGSAGSAGSAGNAGAAGAGGSGGGSFDGPAVAAAICATQAQFAGSGNPDAGADAGADAGDAGAAAPTECSPSPTCVDDFVVGSFGFIAEQLPGCVEEMEAYFGCMATQPASAFACDQGIIGLNPGNHGCLAEETAFNEGALNNCAD
jgi:hypothetical protein